MTEDTKEVERKIINIQDSNAFLENNGLPIVVGKLNNMWSASYFDITAVYKVFEFIDSSKSAFFYSNKYTHLIRGDHWNDWNRYTKEDRAMLAMNIIHILGDARINYDVDAAQFFVTGDPLPEKKPTPTNGAKSFLRKLAFWL